MKKIKSFMAWMLVCITALSVTSCLKDNDDDSKQLTPEQVAQYMRTMDGEY